MGWGSAVDHYGTPFRPCSRNPHSQSSVEQHNEDLLMTDRSRQIHFLTCLTSNRSGMLAFHLPMTLRITILSCHLADHAPLGTHTVFNIPLPLVLIWSNVSYSNMAPGSFQACTSSTSSVTLATFTNYSSSSPLNVYCTLYFANAQYNLR